MSSTIAQARIERRDKKNLAWRKTPLAFARDHSWLALIFAAVVAANLIHHFALSHVRDTLAFDGKDYLTTCQELTSMLLSFMGHHLDNGAKLATDLSQHIAIDGPVVPGLPALLFTLIGRVPEPADWRLILGLYIVLAGLSSCMVAWLTQALTESRKLAIAAGLAFGLYPPAIVNAGRFCTEVPTIFFMLLFLVGLTWARQRRAGLVLAGFAAVMIALCKAALIPALALSGIVAIARAPRPRQFALVLVLSAACTMLPWSLYTKIATGKMSITASRFPVYNATVACDHDTDGWCTTPPSKRIDLFNESESPVAVLMSSWQTDPANCLKLSARKLTRLWSQPWNDFRRTVFGITPELQGYIHWAFIFSGFLGLFAFLFRPRGAGAYFREPGDGTTDYLGALICVLLLGNLGFAVFQAMGRYGFVSMPLFVILAAYGLSVLHKQTRKEPRVIASPAEPPWQIVLGETARAAQGTGTTKRIGLVVALACLTTSGVLLADWLTRFSDSHEVTHLLAPREQAFKSIDLRPAHIAGHPKSALVLIDANSNLNGASFELNGHRIEAPLRSFKSYDANQYLLYNTMREHSQYMDVSVDDFRQWRALPVPADWINLSGVNIVRLTNGTRNAELYGDSRPNLRPLLSPYYFASDLMVSSMTSMESRIASLVPSGLVAQSSTIGNAGPTALLQANDESGLSDSLRMKLALSSGGATGITGGTFGSTGSSASIDSTAGATSFHGDFKAGDPIVKDAGGGDVLRINKYVLRFARSTACSLDLPPLRKSSHLLVRVTGRMRVLKGPGRIGVPVTISGSDNQCLVLGRSPNYLTGTHEWQSFAIEDLVPAKNFGYRAKSVAITLYPCPWQSAWYGSDRDWSDAELRDVRVEVRAVDAPELSASPPIVY
jgi:hypothetical protein